MYIGSADLMPRNLDARVELLVPIEKPELQAELERHARPLLGRRHQRLDARLPTAVWERRQGRTRSVHRELMERTLAGASPGADAQLSAAASEAAATGGGRARPPPPQCS